MKPKWMQLKPIACEGCGEKHLLFNVWFSTDGVLGIAVVCKCGLGIEKHIKWEDEMLVVIREAEKEEAELKKTAKGRQELKKAKKQKGNA